MKKLKIIQSIVLFIILVITTLFIFLLPEFYDYYNEQNILQIENEVKSALKLDNPTDRLNELYETNNFILVVEGEDYFYSNTGLTLESVNGVKIADQDVETYEENGYQVYLSVNDISAKNFFSAYSYLVYAIIIIIFILFIILLNQLRKLLLGPMERVVKNLKVLDSFDEDELEESSDYINQQLVQFGKDVINVINMSQNELTSEEFEKMRINSDYENIKGYLATVIHDNKGTYQKLKIMIQNNYRTVDILSTLDKLINDSNKVIEYAYNSADTEVDKYDCRTIILDILDETLEIQEDRNVLVNCVGKGFYLQTQHVLLHQLFYNLIINAIEHASGERYIMINITPTSISFTNSIADESINTSDIFKLGIKSENSLGAGFGLQRVSKLVDKLGLEISASSEDHTITIEVSK